MNEPTASFPQHPEGSVHLGIAQPMADAMVREFATLLLPPEFDRVIRGHGDTGTITLASDESISARLLRAVRREHPGSYSEEDDPSAEDGSPVRCQHSKLWVIDPVDGSGDRRAFAGQDRPAARGYSILATLYDRGEVVTSLCARPAYGELWHFSRNGIQRFRVEGETLSPLAFSSAGRSVERGGRIRVGVRPAYPQTNFPESLLLGAGQRCFGDFQFEPVEVGGAGDAFAQLIEGRIDLLVSGRKTDWKVWDTAPFVLPVQHLRGRLTDYQNRPLTRGPSALDQWHTDGVIASVGCERAHEAYLEALLEARALDPTLVFDPRLKR